jgi:transcription elongation factor SPT6
MGNLTLTWKVEEDIYQHIDIQERNKPNKFSLGKTLLIGNKVLWSISVHVVEEECDVVICH